MTNVTLTASGSLPGVDNTSSATKSLVHAVKQANGEESSGLASFSASTGFSSLADLAHKALSTFEMQEDLSADGTSPVAENLPSEPSTQAPLIGQYSATSTLGFSPQTNSVNPAFTANRTEASGNNAKVDLFINGFGSNVKSPELQSLSHVAEQQLLPSGSVQENSHTRHAGEPFSSKMNQLLSIKTETGSLPQITLPLPQQVEGQIHAGQSATLQAAISSSPAEAAQPRAVWANLQMDSSPGKWGEQMLQVLQDRVTLQASQNMQEARIRLDPPDLGKLDLIIRVDGDRLNVQINAAHGAIRDALAQVSERLRLELQQQQFVHVDVNVGDGERGQPSQHQAQPDDEYQPAILSADVLTDATINTTSEHWLSTKA
ncbi:flagellar hook-length control protein FliK [Photobacterium sp.]|uniref:flagellar hook-length control protein FliK n=1 Tax=Photobacterium sp. TaxID=660 RepID=UPI00299CFD17|nr:flagellar hook-length control protein FliK [Photobacterium sp.]MDX1301083.1 flagellar hook-length control protein FliK [Photobacterium sp.]